jgi:uncharacterized protein (UPF0147 family)
MATDPDKPTMLESKQEQAITALLADPNIKRAAESLGIGERTLHRWLDDPKFAREFRKARRQAFNITVGLTQKYSSLAVQTLAKIANDSTAPHSARVAASASLLKFAREAIELDDLAGRLDEVEARLSVKHVENTYGKD